MQASVCMRAALILYSFLVLVEVGLKTAMADPEAVLRASLATQHLGGNISSVALQGEIDAGRHAVKGIITLQPPGAVPTAEGLRAEVWTAMMPVTQRIIQVHGTVTQAQLLAIVPNIYTCVVFRTRLRSRYKDFMDGGRSSQCAPRDCEPGCPDLAGPCVGTCRRGGGWSPPGSTTCRRCSRARRSGHGATGSTSAAAGRSPGGGARTHME